MGSDAKFQGDENDDHPGREATESHESRTETADWLFRVFVW